MTVKVKLPFSHFFPPTHSISVCHRWVGAAFVRWFVGSFVRCGVVAGVRCCGGCLFVRWFVRSFCLFVCFVCLFVRSLACSLVRGWGLVECTCVGLGCMDWVRIGRSRVVWIAKLGSWASLTHGSACEHARADCSRGPTSSRHNTAHFASSRPCGGE